MFLMISNIKYQITNNTEKRLSFSMYFVFWMMRRRRECTERSSQVAIEGNTGKYVFLLSQVTALVENTCVIMLSNADLLLLSL